MIFLSLSLFFIQLNNIIQISDDLIKNTSHCNCAYNPSVGNKSLHETGTHLSCFDEQKPPKCLESSPFFLTTWDFLTQSHDWMN